MAAASCSLLPRARNDAELGPRREQSLQGVLPAQIWGPLPVSSKPVSGHAPCQGSSELLSGDLSSKQARSKQAGGQRFS